MMQYLPSSTIQWGFTVISSSQICGSQSSSSFITKRSNASTVWEMHTAPVTVNPELWLPPLGTRRRCYFCCHRSTGLTKQQLHHQDGKHRDGTALLYLIHKVLFVNICCRFRFRVVSPLKRVDLKLCQARSDPRERGEERERARERETGRRSGICYKDISDS
ncbi:hypothetical protein Q8A73_003482 [Channa argus]|nr:hypothetical protein Q8A73_003482 [Channa argus]